MVSHRTWLLHFGKQIHAWLPISSQISSKGLFQLPIPNYHFWNQLFHLQVEIRKKTILNYQFGNKLFHSQMGVWNKPVPNYQLWIKLFHLQKRRRNKQSQIANLGTNRSLCMQIGIQNKTVSNIQFAKGQHIGFVSIVD